MDNVHEIADGEDAAVLALLLPALMMDDEDEDNYGDEEPRHPRFVDIEGWRLLDNISFKENFRMGRAVFQRFIAIVGEYLEEKSEQEGKTFRLRAPLDEILMIGLWMLFNPDTFRSTGGQFGKAKSVVYQHYCTVIEALHALNHRFIKWPNVRQRRETREFLERETGYPGVVGLIDGTHVTITAPLEHPQDYINRHDQYSILVQGTCDHKMRYIDVYCGQTGRIGDVRNFDRSPLNINLLTRHEMMGEHEHLLGDGAYTLTSKIITPYPDVGPLTPRQRRHNRSHTGSRSIVENSYCFLKGKNRRLKALPMRNRDRLIQHIMASMVLHNFILLDGEDMEGLPPTQPPNIDNNEYERLRREARNAGAIKRERIADYIQQ